jgi:hypothetical protein
LRCATTTATQHRTKDKDNTTLALHPNRGIARVDCRFALLWLNWTPVPDGPGFRKSLLTLVRRGPLSTRFLQKIAETLPTSGRPVPLSVYTPEPPRSQIRHKHFVLALVALFPAWLAGKALFMRILARQPVQVDEPGIQLTTFKPGRGPGLSEP